VRFECSKASYYGLVMPIPTLGQLCFRMPPHPLHPTQPLTKVGDLASVQFLAEIGSAD
jgi:hypothetical protein